MKRGLGGDEQEAGLDFRNAEGGFGFLNFPAEDSFQPGAAAEGDPEGRKIGKSDLEADGGGLLLAGEIGLGPLPSEMGKEIGAGAEKVECGGAPDFVKGLAEIFLFPFPVRLLEEVEELFFLRLAGPDLGKGIHGVAPDLFGGILQEGEEPLADRLLQVGRAGLGKAGADGANEGDPIDPFFGPGLVKAGNFILPKLFPG